MPKRARIIRSLRNFEGLQSQGHTIVQDCFAFPYIYDWATLHEVPFPECRIVRRAVRHLGGRIGEHLVAWVRATRL